MASPFIPIDPAAYAHAPNMSVSSGIALANALADACPEDAEPKVKRALKHLRKVADKAMEDFTARNKKLGVYSEEDSRVLDNQADRAWGALRMRLQAMAMIAEQTDKAPRAAAMDWKLFQGSTEFLKYEYAKQGTRMASSLKQIDDDELQAEIDALCGPEFLAACREVQPKYDRMVSERMRRDEASSTNLTETLRELGAAIVNYASKVVGAVEHDAPASHDAARAALRPILAYRETQAREPAAAAPATPATAATPPR